MTQKELLRELEELAKKLTYELSYEALRKTAPYVKSGAVRLDDKKLILVDKDLSVSMKIDVILSVIKDENFEDIFVKPYVKNIIEKARRLTAQAELPH